MSVRPLRRWAPSILLATFLALFATPGFANPLTVMSTADNGAQTLRQAIADSANGDLINFDSSLAGKTITLTSGELLISKNIKISTTFPVTVSGNKASRVFDVPSGITVTLQGLTIQDGHNSAALGGGGIYNAGALILNSCTVKENVSTTGGGGIRNDHTLFIVGSTISGNVAHLTFGGGIDNVFASLTLRDSTVSGNVAGVAR